MREMFKSRNGIEFGVDNSNFARLMFRDQGYALPIEEWTPVGQSVQNDSKHGFSLESRLADALREFFQHERDKELGRWRWPENPDYVVYPDCTGRFVHQPAVIIFNERNGGEAHASRGGEISAFGVGARDSALESAAAAYFAAHPEPKPWHDAKPGEVWLVTWEGRASASVVKSADYSRSTLAFDDGQRATPGTHAPVITAARRIWPEEEK